MSNLVLDQLAPQRGRQLFAPITQQFGPGNLVGVVGPNGAGKSSLLNAITGRGIAYSGTARLGSRTLGKLRPRELARTVSFVGQDTFTANELRVRDVVAIGLRAGKRATATSNAITEALEALDIAHLAERNYAHLSGGERQLTQIARVFAQESPVMLLDEPTSALDLRHQLTVLHALKAQARAGRIVIVTIHDLTQTLRWADQVIVIASGQTICGSPRDVLTPELIRQVYGVTAEVFRSPSGSPTMSLVRTSCKTATSLTRPWGTHPEERSPCAGSHSL